MTPKRHEFTQDNFLSIFQHLIFSQNKHSSPDSNYSFSTSTPFVSSNPHELPL